MSIFIENKVGKVEYAVEHILIHEQSCITQQKAGRDGDESPDQNREAGYTDWVIVALHSLQKYLGHPYRRLMDVLREMPVLSRISDYQGTHCQISPL